MHAVSCIIQTTSFTHLLQFLLKLPLDGGKTALRLVQFLLVMLGLLSRTRERHRAVYWEGRPGCMDGPSFLGLPQKKSGGKGIFWGGEGGGRVRPTGPNLQLNSSFRQRLRRSRGMDSQIGCDKGTRNGDGGAQVSQPREERAAEEERGGGLLEGRNSGTAGAEDIPNGEMNFQRCCLVRKGRHPEAVVNGTVLHAWRMARPAFRGANRLCHRNRTFQGAR